MGKIWEFFEHLDEYVYVSDPETNQLVYMNQKALKSYGFQSKEEIVGLKCYEVLQGNSAPCSICNNEQLRPGYFMGILQSGSKNGFPYQGYPGGRRWQNAAHGDRY